MRFFAGKHRAGSVADGTPSTNLMLGRRVKTPRWCDRGGQASSASRHAGFTVIELLAASTLAAMMMVLVMGVIGSLSARQRALRAEPPHGWQDQLRDEIRWDLTNSESITPLANGASLRGSAGSDWGTGIATHRPTEIFYFVKQIDGRSWLIRRETHLDELTNRNSREELVCADVSEFSIQAPSYLANNVGLAIKHPDYAVVRLLNRRGHVILDEEIRWR